VRSVDRPPSEHGARSARPSCGRRRVTRSSSGRRCTKSQSLLSLAILLVLAGGCAPSAVTTVRGDVVLPPSDPLLARPGPHSVVVREGALRSSFGCTLAYEVHEAEDRRAGATVVLAHGFLRDLGTMRGWARHLASHGLRTVVVSLCNATPWDGRHERSAIDLRHVADALRPPDGSGVLYAGFSAGGLAALLAASDDPGARAYLALDAVDSGGLAARGRWSGPSLFLMAEPSSCNADSNMVPIARTIAPEGVIRIPNATHCHFEDPFDPLCAWVCGRVEPTAAHDAIRDTVRSLATAWLLRHAAE
jgi:dienelactone hydrolase